MVFLYDDVASPIGFLYRTSAYAQDTYDAYFYEKNIFGDVVAVYNDLGACVASYSYDAWGNHSVTRNVNGIATMNPIRYRGYYYDTHTGLYYLQSRYYNPEMGRFISPDCYVSTGQGLLGNNMYIYCNNNPVMGVDPSGEAAAWNSPLDALVAMHQDILKIAEQALNKDGTYSLYDNQRFDSDKLFHEQILVFDAPSVNADLTSMAVTRGGSLTLVTGGWEWDHLDLSLLDFGRVSAEVSQSPSEFSANFGASVWSPSATFSAFGGELSVGLNFGLEFGISIGKRGGINLGIFKIYFSK